MNSKLIRFLLVMIVTGVLIVGGIYVVKQNLFKRDLLPTPATSQTPSSAKNSGVQTARDKNNLPVTPATTSGQPVEQYIQTVEQEAKESSTLSFTNCLANPGEVKVKTGQKITIKNNDAQDISLDITIKFHPTISAHQSIEAAVTQEPSVIAYGCSHKDGTTQVRSGVMDITK